MSISPGLAAYKLSFQLCPIILNNGIAAAIPGGMLPLILFTQGLSFVGGLLSGSSTTNLDNYFANFRSLPGASVIAQRIGKYPFANQATAANAVIQDSNTISMMMTVPARDEGGYALKLATMMALIGTLRQHNASGGTYTIATPSYFYIDCVMTPGMRDVTPAGSAQPQIMWQMDFEQPLLTLDTAQQAQNSLMSKISNGQQIDGQPTWSGLNPSVGVPPSLGAQSVIPAASNTAGSSVAAPTSFTTGAP